MTPWTTLRRGAAAAAAAAVIIGTGAAAHAAAAIDAIKERGTIIVGLSTFVPWAMRDKSGGLMGFEVDVANKLAEDLGVKIEFVPTQWSGIIPALLAEKFDVIIGGMSITPERQETVDFTVPYAHSGQQMALNAKMAGDMTREQMNASSVTLSCRRGVAGCSVLEDEFPKATLLQFDDDAQAFQEVLNGNAHGVISSAPKPAYEVEDSNGVLKLAFDGAYLSESDEAMALRKGDQKSIDAFNEWIEARTADGWLKERHDYWFGSQAGWKDKVAPEQ